MADANKINLKALKENYMKKPEEDKKVDENSNQNSENLTNKSTTEDSAIVNDENKALNEKIKSGKANDKELFSKYESFFKKQEDKIQKKLHKELKTKSGSSKKVMISIIIIVLLIPAYFIYSGGGLESIKASIFGTKENSNSGTTNTVSGTKEIDMKNTTNNQNDTKIDDEKEEKILKENEEVNFGGYKFNIETQTKKSGEKSYHYKGKKYETKEKLRKGLEIEIEKLKRKKVIKLLLEEKRLEEMKE